MLTSPKIERKGEFTHATITRNFARRTMGHDGGRYLDLRYYSLYGPASTNGAVGVERPWGSVGPDLVWRRCHLFDRLAHNISRHYRTQRAPLHGTVRVSLALIASGSPIKILYF